MTSTPITIYLVSYVGLWKQTHTKRLYTKPQLDSFTHWLNDQGFFYQIIEIPTRLTLISN
jgi:hypothetical protein